jgi:3'(2'), 5'-bisphosphate nucleotidase
MKIKDNAILLLAIEAALEAGEKIMKVYGSAFDVQYKEDTSPLTLADQASHEVISEKLGASDIPLLSEEGADISYAERSHWKKLWIVDPLDGTKEFVKRNEEFTVNIALVEDQKPVLGVIYVPVSRELYFAVKDQGAYKAVHQNETIQELMGKAQGLKKHSPDAHTCRIVASRSHLSPETEAYIAEKKQLYPQIDLVSKGSSLKFCLVAEGLADCYPRYAPTMEWDTAAGQIIVEETGKKLIDLSTGESMRYNRPVLRNGWFVVE